MSSEREQALLEVRAAIGTFRTALAALRAEAEPVVDRPTAGCGSRMSRADFVDLRESLDRAMSIMDSYPAEPAAAEPQDSPPPPEGERPEVPKWADDEYGRNFLRTGHIIRLERERDAARREAEEARARVAVLERAIRAWHDDDFGYSYRLYDIARTLPPSPAQTQDTKEENDALDMED